jgi:hypothetical protein
MLPNKTLVSLLLCAAIALSQHSSAVSFCTTTAEGKLRIDDCKYSSYSECKLASNNQVDCMENLDGDLPGSKVAPFCVVTWSTECTYLDYATCTKEAQTLKGFCYSNPEYKKPD